MAVLWCWRALRAAASSGRRPTGQRNETFPGSTGQLPPISRPTAKRFFHKPFVEASGEALSFAEFPHAQGATVNVATRTTAQSTELSFMRTSLSSF